MKELSLHNITFGYESEYKLFNDFSYSFRQGQMHALVGPSGSGKTTLLHVLAGLVMPQNGSYHFLGQDYYSLNSATQEALRSEYLSFMFAQPFLIEELTIKENLLIHSAVVQTEQFQKLVEDFEIEKLLSLHPSSCSSGEQQRISAVRALLKPSFFLLADEPTSHLDKTRASDLMAKLNLFCKNSNLGVICVTHDRSLLKFFDAVLEF